MRLRAGCYAKIWRLAHGGFRGYASENRAYRYHDGMNHKPGIPQILLSAACALLLTHSAYAAAEFTDGTANPPRPSSPDASLESVPVIEPFDPNAPPKTTIPIGPNLTFGGYGELRAETRRNYNLNTKVDDALTLVRPRLSTAISYDPNQYLQFYVNTILEKRFAVEEPVDTSHNTELNLYLAYMTLKNVVEGTRLQIGRQRFIDSKRWLFNQTLDAAMLAYQYEHISVEFSASRFDMAQRDLLDWKQKDTGKFINYYSYLDYKFGKKNHVGVFALYQDEQESGQKQPMFFGLQSEGSIVKRLKYWFQTAMVRGTDGAKHLRGEAIDVGLIKVFDGALVPSVTLAYAFGTGDGNPNDNVDTSFRQTGFQGNFDKFNGVTRFQYYGEVLDPRLSNLMIFTGGVGVKPSGKTSLDLVYHYYLQDYASKTISGSDLSLHPTGLSKDVGSELDLVAGYQEIAQLQAKLVLGYFLPGAAFAGTSRDGAFNAQIQLRYSF